MTDFKIGLHLGVTQAEQHRLEDGAQERHDEGGQHRRSDDDPVEVEVAVDSHAEELRRRHDERFGPAGERGPVRDHPLDDLLGRERGDRQIEPLEPQRR